MFLGIDCGTQGIKALIADEAGRYAEALQRIYGVGV